MASTRTVIIRDTSNKPPRSVDKVRWLEWTGHLTYRQQEMLRFIVNFQDEKGMAPTIRQIGAHMGVVSPNGTMAVLMVLVKKGFIKKTPGAGRGLRVIWPGGKDVKSCGCHRNCPSCGADL